MAVSVAEKGTLGLGIRDSTGLNCSKPQSHVPSYQLRGRVLECTGKPLPEHPPVQH